MSKVPLESIARKMFNALMKNYIWPTNELQEHEIIKFVSLSENQSRRKFKALSIYIDE